MQGGTRAHACIQMAKHESSGQAPNPCCFLLFLPLVVISTSIRIVNIWLWLDMHACTCADMNQMVRAPTLLLSAVFIAGFDVKTKGSVPLIQAVAVAELG